MKDYQRKLKDYQRRRATMLRMRAKGMTYREIGEACGGISRQRVQQIIKRGAG